MKISRRGFNRFCVSMLSLAGIRGPLLAAQGTADAHPWQRAVLVDDRGQPLRASDLVAGENYVFHYPYVTTPCFLIDLGRQTPSAAELRTDDGQRYVWRGGVGPSRSIVAYSAICAHRMSHPARSVSFISYRHDKAHFVARDKRQAERSGVIFCCSERSVYDAADGARVLGGPAPQPLAVVALEYDGDADRLTATATYGGEMFDQFFREFGFRLSLEYGTDQVDHSVGETTTVVTLEEYCRNPIRC